LGLPCRCLPLSHIKEMARGSRDGNIFRSPEERLLLTQNTLSTDKGMAKGFLDKKFATFGHFGVRLLDTVDSGKLSILCKGMAEHLRDKSLSVAILSNPQEGPLLIWKWRGGFGTVYFLTLCRQASFAADHVGSRRRFATECDKLRQCDDLRQNTANHGVPRQRDCSRDLADPTNETVPMGSGTSRKRVTSDLFFRRKRRAAMSLCRRTKSRPCSTDV
jgi:hypothetical protein